MPITPFKIVNEDGTTNQSEYNRCIDFLNSYIEGTVKVYQQLTWENPLEIDLSQPKSAYELINDIINQSSNRLLTRTAFNEIKKLFKGLLDRYGSSIHSYGNYLACSKDFVDGPGYMYDVFSQDEKPVIKRELDNNIAIYYIDDENHTVLEYNDVAYANSCIRGTEPTSNYGVNSLDNRGLVSNITNLPNVYKGNIAGIYSDFQRLSGQYVGSSTLFYYSECNDILYTTGANSYSDSRLGQVINFNYKASVANKTKPARGVSPGLIPTSRENIQGEFTVNAYVPPNIINTEVNYLTPIFLTAAEETEWLIS